MSLSKQITRTAIALALAMLFAGCRTDQRSHSQPTTRPLETWTENIAIDDPVAAAPTIAPEISRLVDNEDSLFDRHWQRDASLSAELNVSIELQRGYIWHLSDQLEIVEHAESKFIDEIALNEHLRHDLNRHYRQLRGLQSQIQERLAAAELGLTKMESVRAMLDRIDTRGGSIAATQTRRKTMSNQRLLDLGFTADAIHRLGQLGIKSDEDLALTAQQPGQCELIAPRIGMNADELRRKVDQAVATIPTDKLKQLIDKAREIQQIPSGVLPPRNEQNNDG